MFTVVFPVCVRDSGLAAVHSDWLRKMSNKCDATALLVREDGCSRQDIARLEDNLRAVFRRFHSIRYFEGKATGWPQAPNYIFQKVAHGMRHQCNPWLWFEADVVALKPPWLENIASRYHRAGKPFMGPVVSRMGHVNGVCVYPSDAVFRMPKAMSATDQAWDYVAKDEMAPFTHDASDIMQHIWSVDGNNASEVGGGDVPRNVTPEKARHWIKPTAQIIHRIKDRSLIDLLMSGKYVP
jgi:hypothetical protein